MTNSIKDIKAVPLIQKIRGQFWKLTQRKTSWGKNEALSILDQACAAAVASILDDLEAEGRQPTPVDLTYEEVTVHMNPPWEEATP